MSNDTTEHDFHRKNKELPKEAVTRQAKYLTNIIEQDHRFIKKRTNPIQCLDLNHLKQP
jgi:transposase-like protein